MGRRILTSLVLALVLGGMIFGLDQLVWPVHEQIVTATKVKKAPTGLDDTIWQSVRAAYISFYGQGRNQSAQASTSRL